MTDTNLGTVIENIDLNMEYNNAHSDDIMKGLTLEKEERIHPLVASLRTGVPVYPVLPDTSVLPMMSHSSSTTSMPVCRICQLPGLEPNNPLISPCRCLGSIKYVHNPCLKKWLEVSCKNESAPPGCELCQYQYIRNKKF